MKERISKKGILFASLASLFLLLIALAYLFDYFQVKADKWNSTPFDLLFFFSIVIFGLAMIVMIILSLVFSIKEKKILSVSPLLVGILSITISISIAKIDYANCDQALYGIPETYQSKLSIPSILEEGDKLEEVGLLLSNRGEEDKIGKDSSHTFTSALKEISFSEHLQGDSYRYDKQYIEYIVGNDDFYGLKIYDTGYVQAAYQGDILGPYYSLYYSFDVQEFPKLYSLATSLLQ